MHFSKYVLPVAARLFEAPAFNLRFTGGTIHMLGLNAFDDAAPSPPPPTLPPKQQDPPGLADSPVSPSLYSSVAYSSTSHAAGANGLPGVVRGSEARRGARVLRPPGGAPAGRVP